MVTDRPSYGHPGPDPLDELIQALQELSVPCGLGLPDGRVLTFGVGAPLFRILLRNELPLAGSITDLSLARGYVNGDIDVEGDVLSVLALRELIPFAVPVRQMLRLTADMLAPAAVANERAIDFHYSLGDDFYLTFLDRKYHFYSQCVFESEDETLEQAAEHKLERMWSALKLQPGMSLLDIGGGWGGLASYAGERGVHVTSLTLNHDSAAYIRGRTGNGPNPAHVIIEDVLEHYPSEPYDHAVDLRRHRACAELSPLLSAPLGRAPPGGAPIRGRVRHPREVCGYGVHPGVHVGRTAFVSGGPGSDRGAALSRVRCPDRSPGQPRLRVDHAALGNAL